MNRQIVSWLVGLAIGLGLGVVVAHAFGLVHTIPLLIALGLAAVLGTTFGVWRRS